MGKGDRRGKGKRQPLAETVELAPTPKRQPNGQHRARADGPRDPQKAALSARCRIFGVKDTRENRRTLSGQHSGSQLGLVMQSECNAKEIPRLWAAWQGLCGAIRTYRVRVLGMSGSAKGASIAMMRERLETDQGHTIDTRDSETRDRDAVNAFMAWSGHLGCLPAYQQMLLHDAEQEKGAPLWDNCATTPVGLATLEALKALVNATERRS